jgi:hypothetical protein
MAWVWNNAGFQAITRQMCHSEIHLYKMRNNYSPSRNVHNDIRHAKGNYETFWCSHEWHPEKWGHVLRGSFRSKGTEHTDLIYMLPMDLKEINMVVWCKLLSKDAFTLYRNFGNMIVVVSNIL